jgi:flagellar protein FlaG
METKVAAVATTPDPTFGQATAAAGKPQGKPAAPVVSGPDPVDLRLVIEEDQASGSFVYKTVNRLTGEVVQSLPRAEILRLRNGAAYTAGQVIKTKA